MESFKIENLTFEYPTSSKKALTDINLSIAQGEFVVLCGESGCGKTTLLKHLKPVLAPNGERCGRVFFEGADVFSLDTEQQASKIGFVMQNPSSQIVCDKVWHELAFGLESLGLPPNEIRTSVAEVATFFGIESWFNKNTYDLSGGEKQILNLASIMAMQPSTLILDEPSGQLSPIAAEEFFSLVYKINRELGVTVVITEHRLGDVIPLSDRVVVMEQGRIIADGTPRETAKILKNKKSDMLLAFPVPMRVFEELKEEGECPITVREGRMWLAKKEIKRKLPEVVIPEFSETVLEARDIWFKYEKNMPQVLCGVSFKVSKGEICAIVGGNGAGKSTLLSVLGQTLPFYRGKIKKKDGVKVLTLPQSPEALFVKNTVWLDLCDMGTTEEKVRNIAKLCKIDSLFQRHPYDLSGGEQQRVALAKVLLANPDVLLLDEPTKGLDEQFKGEFATILKELALDGKAVVIVSHDVEFCAKFCDRCAYLFNGRIVSDEVPRKFFSNKSFYTTSANRMARSCIEDVVLAEDIIYSLKEE